MSIFIDCKNEEIIQVKDKTRIDVSSTFVVGTELTDIEIQPETGADFISVFNTDQDKWFLDWAYVTSGSKTITVRATDASGDTSETYTITSISVADDNLYSNDQQIFQIESELKRYIPHGKNSFNNLHREAQRRILSYLDRKGIRDDNDKPYTKDTVNLESELSEWSLYEVIYMIYTDLFLSVGDKFQQKMNQYRALRNNARDLGSVRIDKDGDGEYDKDKDKKQGYKEQRVIRR